MSIPIVEGFQTRAARVSRGFLRRREIHAEIHFCEILSCQRASRTLGCEGSTNPFSSTPFEVSSSLG